MGTEAFEDDGDSQAAGEGAEDSVAGVVEPSSDLEDVDDFAPEGFPVGRPLSGALQPTVGIASNNGPENQVADWAQRVSALAAACQEAAARSRPTVNGLFLLLFRTARPEGPPSVCRQGSTEACQSLLPDLGSRWSRVGRVKPGG